MIIYLNDLKLTEEQEQEFDKIRNYAFLCEMGDGFNWQNENVAIDRINNIIKFEKKNMQMEKNIYIRHKERGKVLPYS